MSQAIFAAILVLVSSAAAAQSRPSPGPLADRFVVSVNGAWQTSTPDFSDSFTFAANAESARVESDYTLRSARALEVSAGARLWRNLGVGVGVTRFTRSTPTAVTASLPHPFFFQRPRTVGGEVGGLERDERAIHVQARVRVPTGPAELTIFGGPSFHNVKQALITAVRYSESYPYDEAAFEGAVASTAERSRVGIHVGGDVAYFFMRHVGVGFTAMYAATTVDLSAGDGRTLSVKAGGSHTGVGLRLRF